ncbi:HD domain-containing protein [candidate division WOR-3 bacterium]|nr:HD domain-containing protein [candidate division WOR-3 bacterium]
MKIVRDAVWGDIELSALEIEVIDTKAFQRLRKIKQLGCAHLVYPTALHTRFDHSLGCLHCAQSMMENIEKKDFRFTDEDRVLVRMSALLHDITHIPFGHTLEDERRIFPRHDLNIRRWSYFVEESEIGEILGREGMAEKVKETLFGDEDDYRSEIVRGAISADLLDYLARDAYFCGMKIGYDRRVLRYFAVDGKRLVIELFKDGIFRNDAFSETVNLLRSRYFMTERIYYHHSKIACSVMVSKAVEGAFSAGFEEKNFLTLGDEEVLHEIKKFGRGENGTESIIDLYEKRKLYKRCFLHRTRDIKEDRASELYLDKGGVRKKIENKIAKKLKLPSWQIALYCPPPQMYLKEASVNVLLNKNEHCKLNEMENPDISALEHKHKNLWSIYLFISPEAESLRDRAGESCEQEIGLKNELPNEKRGQLSLWMN